MHGGAEKQMGYKLKVLGKVLLSIFASIALYLNMLYISDISFFWFSCMQLFIGLDSHFSWFVRDAEVVRN